MGDPAWLTSSTGSTEQSEDLQAKGPSFKVILVGDVGVGKTTMFSRLRHPQNVLHEVKPTASIGVDACTRTVRTRHGNVTLTVWDTAGAERYRTLTRNYYRNTDAVLLVFNVTDPASLFALPMWQHDVNLSSPTAVHFLVGNKSDLHRKVSPQSIRSFADSHRCQAAFFTSAKTGEGVETAIERIGEHLLNRCNDYRHLHESNSLWLHGSGLQVHGTGSHERNSCCQ